MRGHSDRPPLRHAPRRPAAALWAQPRVWKPRPVPGKTDPSRERGGVPGTRVGGRDDRGVPLGLSDVGLLLRASILPEPHPDTSGHSRRVHGRTADRSETAPHIVGTTFAAAPERPRSRGHGIRHSTRGRRCGTTGTAWLGSPADESSSRAWRYQLQVLTLAPRKPPQ